MKNPDEVRGGRVSAIHGGINTDGTRNFAYALKSPDGTIVLKSDSFEPIPTHSRVIYNRVIYPQPVLCHVTANADQSFDRALSTLHDGRAGDRLNEVIQGLRKHGVSSAHEISDGISTRDGATLHHLVDKAMEDGRISRFEAKKINKAIKSFD